MGALTSSPVRTWVHIQLTTHSGLVAVTGGRAFQQGSLLSSQQIKPYLVHHFGNNTDEGMADEDNFQPTRQFLQIYIHVDQGDYGPIDDIMPLVKAAMSTQAGQPAELISARYLETSQDLQDDLLQTYFRYMRFQLLLSR